MFRSSKKYLINLDSRTDRLENANKEFKKISWSFNRYSAILGKNIKNFPSYGLKYGEIGCIASHFDIIRKECLAKSDVPIIIVEDDIQFSDYFLEKITFLEDNFKFIDWDILYLGGYYHLPENIPKGWYNYNFNSPYMFNNKFKTFHHTSVKHIHMTHSLFTTHCYVINPKSLEKIYDLLRTEIYKPCPRVLNKTRSLDQIYQNLQEEGKIIAFTYTPGLTTQIVSKSDIIHLDVDHTTWHKKVCGDHIYSQNERFNYDSYFNLPKINKIEINLTLNFYLYCIEETINLDSINKINLNELDINKIIIDMTYNYGLIGIYLALKGYSCIIFSHQMMENECIRKSLKDLKLQDVAVENYLISNETKLDIIKNEHFDEIAVQKITLDNYLKMNKINRKDVFIFNNIV